VHQCDIRGPSCEKNKTSTEDSHTDADYKSNDEDDQDGSHGPYETPSATIYGGNRVPRLSMLAFGEQHGGDDNDDDEC
jgi:hypothetical protein